MTLFLAFKAEILICPKIPSITRSNNVIQKNVILTMIVDIDIAGQYIIKKIIEEKNLNLEDVNS